MSREGGNLTSGAWAPSMGAGRFERVEAREPWDVVGTWPHSNERDVTSALAALSDTPWEGTSADARRELVLRAALSLDADDWLDAERVIGLRPAEMGGLVTGIARRVERQLESVRESPAGRGVAVVVPDWTELVADLFAQVARQLVLGRAVLLLPDARLPMCADRVARALLDAGVPEEAIALLHGVTDTGLEAAVRASNVRCVAASGTSRFVARLRSLCDAASVEEQAFRVPRCESFEVPIDADVTDVAHRVVQLAFSRELTLGGQLSGQVGRVFCPQEIHSRFTQEFLAELARSEAARDPIPLIDRDAEDEVRKAWSLGLDEGAAMIFGGEVLGNSSSRLYVPTVFTNVEASMRCVRRQAPAPVVLLLRSRVG